MQSNDDIYVDKKNMNDAIHDDIVLAEVFTSGVRKEARIIRIIKRDLKNLVGEIEFDKNGRAYIELDDDKRNLTIELTPDSTKQCVEGHKVMVNVIKEVNKHTYIAKVVKIIGHKNDPGTDILSIAYKHGIYEDFGSEVEKELEQIPTDRKSTRLNSSHMA